MNSIDDLTPSSAMENVQARPVCACVNIVFKLILNGRCLPTEATCTVCTEPFRGAAEMRAAKIVRVHVKQLERLWVVVLVFGGKAVQIKCGS